jgi:hypothetical protein
MSQQGAPVPDEVEAIRRMIEFRVADIHTVMPGRVVVFDAAKNTAVVQPLLQRVFVDAAGNETISNAPLLKDVPVWFYRCGNFRLTTHMLPQDLVLLLFCERSIDKWSQTGEESNPLPRRKHSWSDAVAIPGGFGARAIAPTPGPIADIQVNQTVLGTEDGTVEIRLDSIEHTITIKSSVAVNVEAPAVNLAGTAGAPVGRVGDAITIDDPAFVAFLAALSPVTVAPYVAPVTGHITAGSPKVKAE